MKKNWSKLRKKSRFFLQKQIMPEKIFLIDDTPNVADSIVDTVIFKEWQIE